MSNFSASEFGLPERVPCPFCGGLDTSLHSPFGPQLSVASYWCQQCSTAFEWMKWEPQHESTSDHDRSGSGDSS